MGDGQGESKVLDWLEVEDGASDWLNGFFTFLYGLLNPLETLTEEEEEERGTSGLIEAQDEDDEDEDEERVRQRRLKEDDKGGQKIIIVGLHNQ